MEINFQLFRSQLKVLQCQKPIIAMTSGRGAGKSFVNGIWCISKLLQDPQACGMLVAPTHQQKEELISYLSQHCDKIGLQYVVNKTPSWVKSNYADHKNIFSIRIKEGVHSYIRVMSAEKYDNLRGFSVSWISLDEAAMMRPEVFDTVQPCLRGRGTDYNYQILLTTTPRGCIGSWLYERFIEPAPEYLEVISCPSIENFYEWTDEKIEAAKASMTELMFRQEMLGEFLDRNMNSILYAMHDDVVKDKPLQGKLCISCDQNVSPMAVGVYYVNGDTIHQWKEIILEEANLTTLVSRLHALVKRPQTIYLYGDRSGNNRTWTGAASFYNQLKDAFKSLGYRLKDHSNQSNPSIFESAETVNRLMEQNKLTISPECKTTLEHIHKATWKADKYETDKSNFDPHCVDLLRYICYKEFGGASVKVHNGVSLQKSAPKNEIADLTEKRLPKKKIRQIKW